jgi:lysozyme
MRQINAEGLELVKSSEGLRLERYQDVAGKWTIGYGHLIRKGEVFDGPITEARATEMLQTDLATAESDVDELVTATITDNQFAALVDFVYNLGRGHFEHSTLLEHVNANLMRSAAGEFDKWVYAGGRRIVQGLVIRRAKEKALFEKGDA